MAVGDPTTERFRPARILINGVRGDLKDFNARTLKWLQAAQCTFFTDYHCDPGQWTHKVRFVGTIPDDLERAAVRFVSDLRAGLDKAVHAAAFLLGSTDLKHAPFPFGESSEKQFLGQLRSNRSAWAGIPPELHDYLISLRPYPEGNYPLAFLGQIANPAKHESILTIDVNKGGIAFGSGMVSMWPQAPGARKDGEFYLCTTPAGLRMPQVSVKLELAFKKRPEKPMRGFATAIENFVRQFSDIVDGIEAVTIRTLAARG